MEIVAIAIRPKSCGASRRARIIVRRISSSLIKTLRALAQKPALIARANNALFPGRKRALIVFLTAGILAVLTVMIPSA
jgi:hypothetical protein